MNKTLVSLSFLFLLFSSLGMPTTVYAVFDVRIQPAGGGNELRYGKIDVHLPYTSKSVAVSIISDSGRQYQLVQMFSEPLSNEQGISLPENNFSVYAIKDGNAPGVLHALQELPVSSGRTIIYTSDAGGTSASFNLVYVLKNSPTIIQGTYKGKLVFMLESPDLTQPAPPVIISVAVDIEPFNSYIDIALPTGGKTIALHSAKTETSSFELAIDCKQPLQEQFEIIQYVTRLPESKHAGQLSPEVLKMNVHGHKKGSGAGGSIPVTTGEQTVYVSGPRGEDDRFFIMYSLADGEKQAAGNYTAQVQYFLKTGNERKLLDTFFFDVTIDRIFDLIVTSDNSSGIQFRDVQLDKKPTYAKMVVEIHSNVGRQYQVSQQLPSELFNNEGKSIPLQHFTLHLIDTGTKGTLQFSEPTVVKTGEMILFLSDKEGSSDKFEIIYEFSADTSIEAGDYAGRIVYTISEL